MNVTKAAGIAALGLAGYDTLVRARMLGRGASRGELTAIGRSSPRSLRTSGGDRAGPGRAVAAVQRPAGVGLAALATWGSLRGRWKLRSRVL